MAHEKESKEIIIYVDENDNEPYSEWIKGIKDQATFNRIIKRIVRLQAGHYGDYASVGEGVFELRLFFGSGYRIYFGEDGDDIVILLCGGDKDSQKKDIPTAKKYWKDYKDENQD